MLNHGRHQRMAHDIGSGETADTDPFHLFELIGDILETRNAGKKVGLFRVAGDHHG